MKACSTLTTAIAVLLLSTTVQAVKLPGPLVETAWLAKYQKQVVIMDVRKDVRSFNAQPVFSKNKKTGKLTLRRVGGHIPGAVLVNYKHIRAKRKIGGKTVTRMIPKKAAFEKLMQQAGVNRDSMIVIVTKGQHHGDVTIATRMYWQIKYYGHDKVAILNGGMAQWILDGRPVGSTARKPRPGNWRARTERRSILATSEDVARAVKSRSAQIIDNRPLSQYLGTYYKKSYVYSPGHIPRAKIYPTELMTKASMPAKFLPVSDLRTLHKALGINTSGQVLTYCNSGHLASGGWFVISELLGNKDVKLYDGSMHQWTLEKRPVTKMKME